ncbi:hypothetical protein SISNIDRAFT_281440 [Sistotremastrum niveocremeum HHB9708]|uniref:Uncharacterized protein n=1 Tax=Sistotremastrum niveocremeum HHB9708 TaxID=1314777 RepID=A0A164Y6G0_9AGAM|nr:hypothetical protein SISNIDRAFT_281440 [Sistotremastrum niveocremeum HHB9708]
MSDTVLASISRILSLDKFLPRTQFSTKDYATILKVAIGSLETSITDITGKSNIVQKFLGTVVNLAHAVIYDTNSPFIPAIALPLEWKQYATTRRQLSKLFTPSTDFSSSSPPPPFSTETDAHIRRVHSLQTPHAPRRIPSSLRTPIAQPSPLAHKSSQSRKPNVRPPPTRTAMKRVVFESPLQPESKEGQEPSNDSDDSFSISSTPRSTLSVADELDKLTLKDRPESSPAVRGDHVERDEFGPRPAPPNFTTVAEAASKIATTKTRQNASEATIRESTDPRSESEADMDISESESEEVPPLDTRVRIQWRAHLKEKTHLFNEPQPLRHAISTVEIRRNAIRRLAGGK